MIADASNFVGTVDTAFIFIVSICVFFLVLITGMMILFIAKYSRKKNPRAKNVHGSVVLEVTWTVIPTLLVLVMFWVGWSGYKEMISPPKDSMIINVYAQMWRWQFEYPNGVKSDTLYVPVNKPIRVNLHSKDVDHSFYVPAFRIKRDVIPTRNNFAWFVPKKLGRYNVECAEYCGLNHSYMLTKVVVMRKDDFNSWLKSESKDSTSSSEVASSNISQKSDSLNSGSSTMKKDSSKSKEK
jgi:cytochrome c oxidase subunit II